MSFCYLLKMTPSCLQVLSTSFWNIIINLMSNQDKLISLCHKCILIQTHTNTHRLTMPNTHTHTHMKSLLRAKETASSLLQHSFSIATVCTMKKIQLIVWFDLPLLHLMLQHSHNVSLAQSSVVTQRRRWSCGITDEMKSTEQLVDSQKKSQH